MAWTANTPITISMVTREALRVLENELTFTRNIQRNYDDKFAIAGAKIGTVLNIRKPPRYQGRIGQAIAQENATETSVPLSLNRQRGVDFYFTTVDLSLNIDDFSKRFIRPAVANVANGIDFDLTSGYGGATPQPGLVTSVYNVIGTVGTAPSAALTYLQAGQRLNEEACPPDDRVVVLPPSFVPPIIDALKGLFQSSEQIAEQYRKGMMGIGLGFEWFMDQNMPVFTAGLWGGAPIVSGASQTGNSLITSGWPATSAILNAGDVFTMAGVYAVNPVNKQSTGALRQFVVTAPVTSAAAGNTTISIWPPIIPAGGATVTGQYASNLPDAVPNTYGASVALGGGFQNVTASPNNSTPLVPLYTPAQSSPIACAFHDEAFAFGCADLIMPNGVDMAARVADDQLGMSIRLIRAYEISTDRFPARLDILYGWALLYGEMACRIGG